ncbi:MAG: sulfate ABC transporter ATP-binding protein, partial [Cyanobacteria bacterium J06636_27]
MGIVVEKACKQFGSFKAVDNVDLEIKSGSLVALLGPSGSGKSTLLRLIAGLEMPDSGKIWLTGKDATCQSVQERNIGFVFQHYALFKHMTVRKNIAFGLEIRKAAKAKIKAKVEELLDLVQLSGLGDRYPSQLSGGQRQRVALARALAVEPKVLLLDEPFGALDARVRKDLRAWLRRLHDEVHVTTVFVTHDQEEAMEVSDEIVVMNKGKVEQIGTPAEIYDHPATAFVMSFIGPVNVLPSTSRIFQSNG